MLKTTTSILYMVVIYRKSLNLARFAAWLDVQFPSHYDSNFRRIIFLFDPFYTKKFDV